MESAWMNAELNFANQLFAQHNNHIAGYADLVLEGLKDLLPALIQVEKANGFPEPQIKQKSIKEDEDSFISVPVVNKITVPEVQAYRREFGGPSLSRPSSAATKRLPEGKRPYSVSPSRASPDHKRAAFKGSPVRAPSPIKLARPMSISPIKSPRMAYASDQSSSFYDEPTRNEVVKGSTSPTTSRPASPVRGPRLPLKEVDNMSPRTSTVNKKLTIADKDTSSRPASRAASPVRDVPKGNLLARLMMPTAASTSRQNSTYGERVASPLARRNNAADSSRLGVSVPEDPAKPAATKATFKKTAQAPAEPKSRAVQALQSSTHSILRSEQSSESLRGMHAPTPVPIRLPISKPAAEPKLAAPAPQANKPATTMRLPGRMMGEKRLPQLQAMAAANRSISASPAQVSLPEIADSDDSSLLLDWANTAELEKFIHNQKGIEPSTIFGSMQPLDMAEVFDKPRRARGSSAAWDRDGLTMQERKDYAKQSGSDTPR